MSLFSRRFELKKYNSAQLQIGIWRNMKLVASEILLTLFSLFLVTSEGFKVLGVFPTQWQSHWKIGVSVVKQLASVGHDITLVSPFELKEPNIRNALLTNYPEG